MQKAAGFFLGIILLASTASTAYAGVESAYFEAPKNIEADTELKVLIRANLSQDEHSTCYVKTTLTYSGNLKLKNATVGNYPSPITFQQNLQNINMTTGSCSSAGYTGSYTLATLVFNVASEGKATITSKAWKNDDIEVNGSVARLTPLVIDVAPSSSTTVGPRFQGVTVTPYVGAIKLSWGSNVPAKDVKLSYTTAGSDKPIESKVDTLTNRSFTGLLDQLKASSSYNFTLSGIAEDGTALRYDGYATTKGYPVRIFVEQSETPIANASVIIDDYTYKTDSEGFYSTNMPPGSATVRVEANGKTVMQDIVVAQNPLQEKGTVVDRQDFTITLGSEVATQGPGWKGYAIGVTTIVLLLAGVITGLWLRKRAKKLNPPAQQMTIEPVQPPDIDIRL